jgi:hypothetical protein
MKAKVEIVYIDGTGETIEYPMPEGMDVSMIRAGIKKQFFEAINAGNIDARFYIFGGILVRLNQIRSIAVSNGK